MTSPLGHPALAADAAAAPGWLHVAVMVLAVLVLLYNLSRHSS
ncbi:MULTISPECIES: hypothetical protein [unclassified Streptomyces]